MGGNDRKAFKSGIWYTISNFAIKGVAFLTTPIFTRLMSKTEYGIFNNYLSVLSILSVFVTLNLESTLISARYDFEKKLDEYILSVLSLSSISVCIWGVIAGVFNSQLTILVDLEGKYIYAMLLYLLFLPPINLYLSRERYSFEYKKTVCISLLVSIGTALVSVVLVSIMQDKLEGRIIGSIIPTCLVGFFCYLFFLIKGKKISSKYWKYAIPICLPYIPHMLSLTLLNSIDKVMITKWCGPEANAIYSLSYTCGSMITLFMISMNSAFAPWLGEKLNSKDFKSIRNISKPYILAFAYMALGIILIAPEILMIIGGSAYEDSKYVMAPIAMGCVCQFLYTMFVNVEQFSKKTVGMAVASIVAAGVNTVLNMLFIPTFGYIAAAYTTLAGYVCLLAIHMFLVKRMKLSEIYDYKFIVFIVFIGCCLTAIISRIYHYDVIRYICILLYVFIGVFTAYSYRHIIMRFLRINSNDSI